MANEAKPTTNCTGPEAMILLAYHSRRMADLEDWAVNDVANGTRDQVRYELEQINLYATKVLEVAGRAMPE